MTKETDKMKHLIWGFTVPECESMATTAGNVAVGRHDTGAVAESLHHDLQAQGQEKDKTEKGLDPLKLQSHTSSNKANFLIITNSSTKWGTIQICEPMGVISQTVTPINIKI